MKSLVCNVVGMALGVTCLALIVSRPAAADDDKATQKKAHVVVVKSGDDQTTQETQQVVVVKTDNETVDMADALKKALHGKLGMLPADIREKIKQKLRAVKEVRDSQTKEIQMKVLVVGSDEEAGETEQSASQAEHTATVVAHACPDGEEQQVTVAVAVDGEELAGDAAEKTMTVTVKDGQVTVNGKPLGIPALKGVKRGQMKVLVSADAESGETRAEGDAGRKVKHRKMVIVGQDGVARSHALDADAPVVGSAVVEARVVGDEAESQEGTFTWTIVGAGDAAKADGTHKIHLRALRVEPESGKPQLHVTVAPGAQPHHAVHVSAPAGEASAEVARRLESIEAEIKEIHKLLEAMRQDGADD